MKKNLLILLGLLVLCGVAARYLQGQSRARAALAEDICKSYQLPPCSSVIMILPRALARRASLGNLGRLVKKLTRPKVAPGRRASRSN